jgi:hypothetical protein
MDKPNVFRSESGVSKHGVHDVAVVKPLEWLYEVFVDFDRPVDCGKE